jgi:hypothetical protein
MNAAAATYLAHIHCGHGDAPRARQGGSNLKNRAEESGRRHRLLLWICPGRDYYGAQPRTDHFAEHRSSAQR